jgi:hypothetical protein
VRHLTDSAAKDTVAPAMPSRVRVDGGARFVNAASADAVRVAVAAPAGASAVGVRIAAGARSVESTTRVSDGVVRLDTSALPDGPLHVSAWSLDAAGNAWAPRLTGTVVKDTVAPATPRQFGVRAGVNNAFDTVNEYNLGSTALAAWFPQALERGDRVTFDVAGKRHTASVSGGLALVSGLRLGSVRDGRLPIAGTVTDAAGNVTHFGAAVTKDTTRPVRPRAAWLERSTTLVGAHQRCVAVRVAFDRPADAGDRITVKLRSERNHELMVSAAVPGGARVVDVACLRAWKLPAGRVRILGITKDAAGNRRFWKGGYGSTPAR